MSCRKKIVISLVLFLSFIIGFIVNAYEYSIDLPDGFATIPAPIRLYEYFSYESKCAMATAAETWVLSGDSEYVYISTESHNDNTFPNHNGYNDVSKGYRGSSSYVARRQVEHLNSGLTSSEETDVDFNVDFPFGDASTNSNVFDVQSITLHEFGHLLGLGDSNANNAAMTDAINTGQTRRSITIDDQMGIYDIYY